jgi:hypothetical protein
VALRKAKVLEAKLEESTAQLAELRSENGALAAGYEVIQESLADLQLKLDDIGWKPLGSEVDMEQMPRATIYSVAQVTRALAVINPLIMRAIAVRTAYIWGNGVEFEGKDSEDDFFKKATVKKWLTTDKAWQEMEKAADTDGNFFVLCTKSRKRGRPRAGVSPGQQKLDIQRVPFQQITGYVTNPDNHEDVWFYRREWTTVTSDGDGIVNEKTNVVYYPAIDYDQDNGTPAKFGDYRVEWSSAIAHYAPNKQVGWVWGVPLIWGGMFWSKAHKEFLEIQLQLTKAYARFAFKATTQNSAQTKAVATKIGGTPGTDAMSGQPQAYGGTFAGNVQLQSIGKPGGAVDFNAGRVLASYVAAAMNVPMSDLLADAGDANRAATETVSGSNEKVLRAEQNNYKVFFESIFEWLGLDVEVKFPAMTEDLLHFRIQAIQQAAELHMFTDQEIRELLLDAFDVDWSKDVPTEDDMQMQLLELNRQAEQAKQQADAAAAQADAQMKLKAQQGGAQPAKPAAKAAGKAKKPATSAPSYGNNSNRDAVGQHKYTHGKNG